MAVVDGKVVFDETEQQEVNRIVQERLARAKAEKPEDYETLKELEKELEYFGYTGSAAEKKEAIRKYKEQMSAQKELEELQERAEKEGTSPELLKEIKELKAEIADLKSERQAKKAEEESKKKIEQENARQIEEFSTEFPDVDRAELQKDDEFWDFMEGSGFSLAQGYKKYLKFKRMTEEEALTKYKSKEAASTGSGKGSAADSKDYGLSAEQKKSLEDWNKRYPHLAMTAKEYKKSLG